MSTHPYPVSTPAAASRFAAVDALRGAAMLWMTAYHLGFDLNHFGHIRQDFYRDPFWTGQRTAIVSLFLFTAGLGQAIAAQQGRDWPRFWRRWAQVAGCALLVTAGSYAMYPNSFIYFGVLHGMAVMLVLARLLAGAGGRHAGVLCLLGAALVLIPVMAAPVLGTAAAAPWAELLNSRALNWLGLVTRKPVTEDYVPLLPWLGVMFWGLAAGRWLLHHRPAWLQGGAATAVRPLAWLGRWSLPYYMLHQPLLIGALMAFASLK